MLLKWLQGLIIVFVTRGALGKCKWRVVVTEKIISVWDTDKMCEGFQEGIALLL